MDQSHIEPDVSTSSILFSTLHSTTVQKFGTVRESNGHANVLDTFVPIHRPGPPSGPGHERSPSPAQGEYIIAHEDTTQHETHYSQEPTHTPGVVNINVHSPGPAPIVDDKYAAAQDEISRLRALVASLNAQVQTASTLRRRSRAVSDDGTDSVADDETIVDRSTSFAGESGVPLQVVIIIALGVFVTTYLFF